MLCWVIKNKKLFFPPTETFIRIRIALCFIISLFYVISFVLLLLRKTYLVLLLVEDRDTWTFIETDMYNFRWRSYLGTLLDWKKERLFLFCTSAVRENTNYTTNATNIIKIIAIEIAAATAQDFIIKIYYLIIIIVIIRIRIIIIIYILLQKNIYSFVFLKPYLFSTLW
eukprot:gene12968-8824_t